MSPRIARQILEGEEQQHGMKRHHITQPDILAILAVPAPYVDEIAESDLEHEDQEQQSRESKPEFSNARRSRGAVSKRDIDGQHDENGGSRRRGGQLLTQQTETGERIEHRQIQDADRNEQPIARSDLPLQQAALTRRRTMKMRAARRIDPISGRRVQGISITSEWASAPSRAS